MQQSNYDRLLGILCSVLDAYSAVVFFPARGNDGEALSYSISAAFSLGPNIDFSATIPEGRGLVGWLLRNKEPLLVSNFDRHKHRIGYYKEDEEDTIKAFMGCPLPGELGAICVDSKRQYSFSEKDQKVLHLFADLIARFELESSGRQDSQAVLKYYAALCTIYTLRRRHSRWSDFLRYLLDLMAAVTGFGYCALFTLDSGNDRYRLEGENITVMARKQPSPVFPITHGIVGWVFRNGVQVCSDRPEGSPDAMLVGRAEDIPQFQSVVALPIIIQRKTRGVLCLAHDTPLAIQQATQDFVRMAAEHLSLFLENLYLKCRLRDMHNEASFK